VPLFFINRIVFIGKRLLMKQYNKQRLFEVMQRLDPSFKSNVLHEEIEPQNLNEILKGYIVAALWTEEERLMDDVKSMDATSDDYYDEEDETPDEIKFLRIMKEKNQRKTIESFSREDIEPDSLIRAYQDIKEFIRLAGDEAITEAIGEKGYEQLGHDIWLTRNGHGAGFFDHSYENEQRLMNAAQALKEVDLYINDDMKLSFSNE